MQKGINGFQKGRAKTDAREGRTMNRPKTRMPAVLEYKSLPEKERAEIWLAAATTSAPLPAKSQTCPTERRRPAMLATDARPH